MGQKKGRESAPADLIVRACGEIVHELVRALQEGRHVNLNALKGRVSKQYGLSTQPKLVEIIAAIPEEHRALLLPRLKAKPVRTASGIAVVAVMCKPHRCPHIAMTGNICVYVRAVRLPIVAGLCSLALGACCRYCPGGPDSDFEYSTQSYTGYEPTSMRAIRGRYHPLAQAKSRLDQLRSLGHSVDKVEYIVMGGTFMSLPEDYRDYFIRNLHDALSGYTSNNVDEAVRYGLGAGSPPSARNRVPHRVRLRSYSEQSATKCIGITIETRPDYCLRPHLSQMLRYGCTRLEIGVQSVYEDVARDTNRCAVPLLSRTC